MNPAPDAARWLADAHALPAAAGDAERLALGRALKELGYAAMYTDLTQAQAATERISRLAAQAGADATRRELQALADWVAGAAHALQGQAAAAVERLDAAGRAFDALGMPQQSAASQVPKIVALAMLGRHDDALACAEGALTGLAAAGDEGAAGKVEINLGSMLLRQDRYADAASHYRRAAVRFAHVGDRRHSVMADIGLAGALDSQYQFDEALSMYERAYARAQVHGLTDLKVVIDFSRGLVELRRGRHADALHWLEAALRETEAHGPPHRLADTRAGLADAYLALNLLPEAAALYEAAIKDCRANDAPVEQAWATAQLAQALARMGQGEAALERIAQARALFEAQANAVGAARLDTQAAALRLADGDATCALALCDSAAAIFVNAGMRGWQLDAQVLAGEALAALGRTDQADARLQAVLAAAEDLPELQARCLSALGAHLHRRGDFAGARARYEQAVQAIEAQQAALHDDELRTAYGAGRQPAFDTLTELALDDGAEPARLLACMERARARALSLGLARPGSAAAESNPWREPLHWLQTQSQQAAATGEAARAAVLQQRAHALEAEALSAHRRVQNARGAAPLPEAHSSPGKFALGALQDNLDATTALVEYVWLDERLAVVVARHDRLHCAELCADGLGERITQLRFQIDSLRFGGALLRSTHAAQIEARACLHLQALHAQLWAPIADWLDGVDHVVVVPHRALHYLPFGALDDGHGPLLERHAISLAPSAALWCGGARAAPGKRTRALVLGVGGAALPHVRAEVESVAAALGPQALALHDDDATLARLRSALTVPVGVLHIACHGHFRADSPYFSSLALADGALTLRDAAALPLAGTFVALSACETGMSRVAPGDELLGLVRGFLLAGAPAVMATLWTVDDAGSVELMTDFYRRFAAGQAPAQALREAQLALRARLAHPYYWAPFALHGRT